MISKLNLQMEGRKDKYLKLRETTEDNFALARCTFSKKSKTLKLRRIKSNLYSHSHDHTAKENVNVIRIQYAGISERGS